MKHFNFLPLTICLLLITIVVSGCGDDNPVNSFEPEVSNATDLFTFRANNAYLVTETLTYTWNCTGDQASIEHLTGRSGGSATLAIFDSDNNPIYSDDLKTSGIEYTQAGNAGTWRIVVDLKEFSGTVYFKLMKM